jgi:hypothetical protein
MLEMLKAHGLDPGPTQQPLLAGAIAGVLSDIPALALLAGAGSLVTLSKELGTSPYVIALLHAGAMAFGGVVYGLIFGRAANDAAGGWLFGISYGFLLWMVAAVPLLQWIPSQPLMVGIPAIGMFVGQLLWGLVLGASFRFVHAPLQSGVDGRLPLFAEKAGSR